MVSDFYGGDQPWDTTGVFQWFERSGQRVNIRLCGCIAYVSPKNAGDILKGNALATFGVTFAVGLVIAAGNHTTSERSLYSVGRLGCGRRRHL